MLGVIQIATTQHINDTLNIPGHIGGCSVVLEARFPCVSERYPGGATASALPRTMLLPSTSKVAGKSITWLFDGLCSFEKSIE